MGLFDGLYFNQQNFGGQAGGLLDLLRTSQMQQSQYQPSQGFGSSPMDANAQQQAGPIAIGDYQMPRIGSLAQYTPDPATIPANAQSTQGQLPTPAQPEATGGFAAGLGGFTNNLHAGPLGAIIGGIGSAVGLQSPEIRQANQTAQFLVSKGYEPALAKTIVSDPVLLRSVLPQVMGVGGQTDDIKEYQFAKREDPSLTFEKFMNRKKATSGEYGMTPIWGTGPDGQPAVLQLGKSGDAKQSVLPQGFNLARDPIKVDGPTGTTILDPQTRQQVGFIPKDNIKKESDEKFGQAQGTARAALANGADIDAAATMKKIDEFVASKGFNEVFGQLDQYRPSWTHSNAGADALARYKQLKGTAFLSAYQMLKGGGAITDIEGQKAGDAMARLDRAQSEAEARVALRDFREAVEMGLMKLKRAAGGEAPQSPARSPAGSVSVDALLKKYGGN